MGFNVIFTSMKFVYPSLLLFSLVNVSIAGYSQKNYDQIKHDKKKFSKRNTSYDVRYKGKDGKNGRNGMQLFNFLAFGGSDGKPGGKGPTLQVSVSGIPSGDSAVLVINITVEGAPGSDHYYINPRQGKITIYAEGGSGGIGGDGEDLTPHYGYNGGNGGLGGTINITFDPSALPYVDCQCIVALNEGGLGGKRGEGGHSGDNYASAGQSGLPGAPGPPVYIKDMNGKILKKITELKY